MAEIKTLRLDRAIQVAVQKVRLWCMAERREFGAAADLIEAGITVQEAARADPETWKDYLRRVGINPSRKDARSEYNDVAKVILGADAPRTTINRFAYAMTFIGSLIAEQKIAREEVKQAVIENGGMTGCALAYRVPEKGRSLNSRFSEWLSEVEGSPLGYLSKPKIDIQDEALCLVRRQKSGKLQVLLISDDKKTVRSKAISIKPVVLE